jgi:hypothetical protein
MSRYGRKDDIHTTPDVHYIANPDTKHEESDVDIQSILKFTAGLFVLCAVTVLLMLLLYRVLQKRQDASFPPAAPMASKDKLPADPKLQLAPGFAVSKPGGETINLQVDKRPSEPAAELTELNAIWEDEIKNGRKDPKTGAVISKPISEAMKSVIEDKSLASRPDLGDGTTERGIQMPTYSSSGRKTVKN